MSTDYDREKLELTRRNFNSLAAWSIFGLGTLGLLGLFGRFFVPNVKYGPPDKFDIGKASDYPDGIVHVFVDQKVAIVRKGADLGAISLVCKHLGCTVAPSATGFDCPCHGSKYDALGNVTHGPAQVHLDWFKIGLLPSGDLQVSKGDIVDLGSYYVVKS
jgi:nitrite reductase/ring-hydroxylating ferredoxin subunit